MIFLGFVRFLWKNWFLEKIVSIFTYGFGSFRGEKGAFLLKGVCKRNLKILRISGFSGHLRYVWSCSEDRYFKVIIDIKI